MKCKHCGLTMRGEPGHWLHAEGKQRGKSRCAVEPYGFNAEASGEECQFICAGSDGREPTYVYPAGDR
ncbi:hypothetical protein SEA_MURP_21 [Gordonia phage Murp]|nr:hypothetical protein SEA_MURP_21 [Gordonia phage Murp]